MAHVPRRGSQGEMESIEDEIVKGFISEPGSIPHRRLGPALLSCTSAPLKDNVDQITRQLTTDIKVTVHPSQLSVVLNCVDTFLQRIALERISTPPSLPKLIGILFYHESSCSSSQCVMLHSLTTLCYLFPGACKEHRSMILKWSKCALFSKSTSLMKEAASLLQVLNSSLKSGTSPEETQFFLSLIQSVHYCITALLGEEEDEESPSPTLLLPDLSNSLDGTEKIDVLVKGVSSLTYLLRVCLLVDVHRLLDVPLDQLWGLIWRMMNNQSSVDNVNHLLLKASWQLLLVTIQSCGLSLLPYSDTIESAIIKTFHRASPASILPLVCKCAEKWVCLRNSCSLQFIEKLMSCVCICTHHRIEACQDYDRKVAFQFKEDKILSLYIDTLNTCIGSVTSGRLSPLTAKSVLDLCYTILSSGYTESNSLSSLLNHPLLYSNKNSFSKLQDQALEELTQNPVATVPHSNTAATSVHYQPTTSSVNDEAMIDDEGSGEDEEMTLDHVGPSPVAKQDAIKGRDTEAPTEAKRRKVEEEVLLDEEELNEGNDEEEDDEDIDVNSMLMKAFDV
ncbi:PREDICTED: uncharacterized protein LOC105315238 [Amphimedon queenslandica]|uniref:Uncharacterized protein n=1 Tax=Amphimedon queenslandica TaxID=400682 RepID=A0A1X7VQT6_AMPQE|nr:PREDICTED: uncharacterized protein LOC105315238 [Amphimedon queenslandica]|eukprot:XP_019858005.1 PREDICTED: uncharacterized protein LOC105315238 [Amphimedon queenslandica]